MATIAIPPTTLPATIPPIGVDFEEEVGVGEGVGVGVTVDYKISDEVPRGANHTRRCR